MQLIIDFDERIKFVNHCKNDLVIAYQKTNKYKCKLIRMNFSLCDENEDLSASINDLFDNYLTNEFRCLRNTYFMRVFRPICSLIIQIEELLEKESITELILIGGSPLAFITLNGGEGEGEKYLYKSSWLFNDFLFQYFNKTIPTRWKNKKNKFIFSLFHVTRENMIFHLRLLKNLKVSFRSKKTPLKQDTSDDKPNIFAFVNLPLQYKHLKNLTVTLKQHNKYFITSFNSIFSRNQESGIILYKITLKGVVKTFKKYKQVKLYLKRDELNFSFKNTKITLPKVIFTRSLKHNYIFFELNLLGLIDLFDNYDITNNSYFITDMTFGEDIILVNEFSKRLNIPHYNFQLVTMSKMFYPQMNLASRYFLFSKKTLDLYQKYNYSYEYYLPFFESDITKNNVKSEVLVVSLFTQPDAFTDKYLSFLKAMLPLLDNTDKRIKFIIKPHYRQNRIREFEQLVKLHKNVELNENSETADKIILQSDFVLSITSSVLFESVTLNRPGIIINIDPSDDKIIYENDICCPEINFVVKSATDLIKILNNSDRYSMLYKQRRDTYLLDNRNIDLNQLFDT